MSSPVIESDRTTKTEAVKVMDEIRQKIRQLLEERQEDVRMISEMVNSNSSTSKQAVKTLQTVLES